MGASGVACGARVGVSQRSAAHGRRSAINAVLGLLTDLRRELGAARRLFDRRRRSGSLKGRLRVMFAQGFGGLAALAGKC